MHEVFIQNTGLIAEKAQLLLVDDSRSMLTLMAQALERLPDTQIDVCGDPRDAFRRCLARQYDMLVIDYMMPDLDGIEFAALLRQHVNYRSVPIVMVTSDIEREVRLKALASGVNDFLNKPFDPLELCVRVTNLLSLRRTQLKLEHHVEDLANIVRQATAEIALREEEMIWRLALAIEMRDGGTGDHVSRVAMISRMLAQELGRSENECQMIYLAAPLHDVGKIGISDSILAKPGKLTPEEMAEMRRHVEYGVRILDDGTSELVRVAAEIAGGHHEKWDGTGYPHGVAGTAIPLSARIVALADVFDALCSVRPYKRAWTFEEAFAEIEAGSGRHFDPDCVRAFVRLRPKIFELMQGRAPAQAPITVEVRLKA